MNVVYALGHWSRVIQWPWCQMGVFAGQRHPARQLKRRPTRQQLGLLQVRTHSAPHTVHRRPPVHSDNTHTERESQTDKTKRWALVSNKHRPNGALQPISNIQYTMTLGQRISNASVLAR